MNVLLTSVGRRNYLVEYFKKAVGASGNVYAANSEKLTTGMLSADKAFCVPPINDPEYINSILTICAENNVKFVLSLFDIDLPYLAKSRNVFLDAGVELIVSDPWVIDIANDKLKTYNFLVKKGISTPKTYTNLDEVRDKIKKEKIKYPLIIKPRWGMGSLSIFKVENNEDLIFFFNYALRQIKKTYLNILSEKNIENSVIVQEFIEGKEFGLDVFNDIEGNYLLTIAKQKIAMRSGETDIAKVVKDEKLENIGKRLSSNLKHRGNMDVDVLENKCGELFVLEMNARLGGGYPFSHLAGANFPLALVDMVNKKAPRGISDIKYGVIGLKSLSVIEAKQ